MTVAQIILPAQRTDALAAHAYRAVSDHFAGVDPLLGREPRIVRGALAQPTA